MTERRWNDDQLYEAVISSRSYRMVIRKLGLVPAGGNYRQIQHRILELELSTSHFTNKGWNVGLAFNPKPPQSISEILVRGSRYQSNKLKHRLIKEGILQPACSICDWAQRSPDGRVPLELDHINGDNTDNRLENLRILCPNCHSQQPTHRGRNKKHLRPGDEIGKHT